MRVTDLATLDIVRGRRTPDGKSLIVARGSAQTDAYLVSEFPLDATFNSGNSQLPTLQLPHCTCGATLGVWEFGVARLGVCHQFDQL